MATEFLAPQRGESSLDEALRRIGAASSTPWSDDRLEEVGLLSREILRHPALRADGPSVQLAYWLRPANLQRIARQYAAPHRERENVVAVPRGLVFHVAPANVDTMFVYSWALAYLCGNPNVVRLTSNPSPIIDGLLDCLRSAMRRRPPLADANRFVTYPHDDAITGQISARCQMRVVWGGDETIRRIRSVPLNPHAGERALASKTSLALVDAERYLTATDDEAEALAARFFGDVFPFRQRACSSPQMVVWRGDEARFRAAVERFDGLLAAECERRGLDADLSEAVSRRNLAFERMADGIARSATQAPTFTTLVADSCSCVADFHGGGGLLTHHRVDRWPDVADAIDARVQTVGCFGIDAPEKRKLAETLGRLGVDRLVPVGEALQFEPIWDGYDLIGDFLSFVTVR